jgi:hypothetical protein
MSNISKKINALPLRNPYFPLAVIANISFDIT